MIRLDKVLNGHLVSFTFATDLKNGNFVALGELNSDGESYKATTIADVAKDRIACHASVELMYQEDTLEEDFALKAGKKGRGYIFNKGDIVTITDDELTGVPAVGKYLLPVVGSTKLSVSETAPTTECLAGEVIEKTTLNGQPATTIEFIVA